MSFPPGEVLPGTADITPYFNPEYWGGHLLDEGPATRTSVSRAGKAIEGQATSDLEAWMAAGAGDEPLATYRPHSIFPHGWYPLGTVVIFNREVLRPAEPHIRPVDMREFKGLPAPEPEHGLAARLEDDRKLTYKPKQLFGADMVYQDANFYAVTAANRKGNTRLVVINASKIIESAGGSIDYVEPGNAETARIQKRLQVKPPSYNQTETALLPIGQVRHYRGGPKHSPRLARINLLQVLSR